MIMVDDLRNDGLYFGGKPIQTSRLTGENPEELRDFARDLGLKDSYALTDRQGNLYFRLVQSKREQAIENGAIDLMNAAENDLIGKLETFLD